MSDADGTGKRARIPGWRVAGKTGTAQKADPLTHRYSVDKRFSSFVGFAPAEAPRLAVGVFVDEPRGEVYGGEVAAPVFREVVEHALQAMGVPPSVGDETTPASTTTTAAISTASAAPTAAASADDSSSSAAIEEAAERAGSVGGVAVPALAGLPARVALRRLEEIELTGEVTGSGRVTAQSPRAGQVVERGARVRLVLAPPRS